MWAEDIVFFVFSFALTSHVYEKLLGHSLTVVHFSHLDSSELIGQTEEEPPPCYIRLGCPFCGLVLYEDEKFPETFSGLRRGTLRLKKWSEVSTFQTSLVVELKSEL